MTPTHSTSCRWLVILLASLLFACGGDDPPLLQNSGEDTGTPDSDTNTGVTNNVVFPGDDMGMEDAGACQPGALDEPDPQFFDANCDGIDGDESKSIFVATYGNDSNAGTKSLPKLTIGAALEAAKTEGKTWVLVEESLYEGGFELVDGVSIAGGYGFGWRRDGRAKTTIRGGAPAIRGLGITKRTVIMDLTIESGSVGPGGTAVGVLLETSSGVVLEGLRINGGRGGDGAAGDRGISGGTGNTGGRGGNAPADSNSIGLCINKDPSDAPAVGTAGAPACGSTEGAGGAGGKSARGTSSGQKGANAPNNGGEGGAGGARSTPGMPGRDGGSGTTGSPGAGGSVSGNFDAATWVGSSGEAGQMGTPGKGGGGGGGGGGGSETIGCDSWGGAGGGGGSGGCGGEGGLGGGFGGASVALMLLDSDATIRNCQIYGGTGGNGGAGGQGGDGGQGGVGGLGGNKEENSGVGGAGGRGGTGGRGGEGGGGSGGPSIGLYSNRPLTTQPVNTNVMQGEGGRGGSAGGAMGRGADGVAEAIRILQ